MWWKGNASPAIIVIPMLLFFAGFVTAAARRQVRYLKDFALLVIVSLPLAAFLGGMGMEPPRYKSLEHPPIYFSEFLMFLLPQMVVSFLMLAANSRPPSQGNTLPLELSQAATLGTTSPEMISQSTRVEESSPPPIDVLNTFESKRHAK